MVEGEGYEGGDGGCGGGVKGNGELKGGGDRINVEGQCECGKGTGVGRGGMIRAWLKSIQAIGKS